ncbi:hypothetical protein F511_41541 [Dorcoceras hygrometricum]|uniref:Uncharacterized protein n=1 Tax=Dorcoceras hygrometricum TaxID=472368 RepID=A0A2Z7BCZ8_9LAMI|nr:hypothetical protein F511_41541 [Dorcoceras hygrometricum]
MRIRPPVFETSICDVKYHVSLALSVIPRGSWGDVARRFTMIRWALSVIPMGSWGDVARRFTMIRWSPPAADVAAAARCHHRKSRSDHSGEEIPSVKFSLSFLVQTGEGIGIPIVDRIRRPKPSTVEVPISS